MKVIFIVPNLDAGGAERVVSILSGSLVETHISVDIILLKDFTVSYYVSPKVNIIYFDRNLLNCSKKSACQILRAYLKKQKKEHGKLILIPFLDVCLKRALVSAFGLNIPVIASERNDPYQKGHGIISHMKANIPYLMASYCIFQTLNAKEYYCSQVQKKSDVIMNPLVISDNIKWRGAKSKRIISVGRLEPQKNQLMLLEAFSYVHKEYPEYALEIYGEGSLKNILQSRIDELHLSKFVFLKGHSSNIYQILEDSFLFVLSSDYEGMSNALLEAMSIGMPVVTTDHPCGGARTLIRNEENGILVPVNDSYSMGKAIKRIIEDDELALKIGKNAYQLRDRLSVKQITNEWLNIFERL